MDKRNTPHSFANPIFCQHTQYQYYSLKLYVILLALDLELLMDRRSIDANYFHSS